MNYRTPTEEEWNDYFELSREHMTSITPDFAPQSEEYCKKRRQGWKTCDEKTKHTAYFYYRHQGKDIPAFHLQVQEVCLISPKGTKKWFKGLVELVHLDEEDRFPLTIELVTRFLRGRDAEHTTTKIFIRGDEECPCCRARREQEEKEEEPIEDPEEPTTEKRDKVEEMD